VWEREREKRISSKGSANYISTPSTFYPRRTVTAGQHNFWGTEAQRLMIHIIFSDPLIYFRPSWTEHPGWQCNRFGGQYGCIEKIMKYCHLTWGRTFISLCCHIKQSSREPSDLSFRAGRSACVMPDNRTHQGGRRVLHIVLCEFCQAQKVYLNPVEVSLPFLTFNNSKLRAHSELFLVTVTSMKSTRRIRNWGNRCDLIKKQSDRLREWDGAEWLTGVSRAGVPDEGLSTTGSQEGNWYCCRKDIHGVTWGWDSWGESWARLASMLRL